MISWSVIMSVTGTDFPTYPNLYKCRFGCGADVRLRILFHCHLMSLLIVFSIAEIHVLCTCISLVFE